MEKRILIALILGLSQCLITFALPQRGTLHMQQHPVKDSKKSPVHAKILKQINSVNDDGSYTFGYEADDGSFKVETRSKDGVVKGKYGFIDPNGQLKTVEYTAGEKSANPGRDLKESDLSMASATDNKATVSKAPSDNDETSSSEETENEDNNVGTFNSFRPHLGGQESPQPQNQYTRQAPQQYFREVTPGNGAAGSGEQDYRGVRPGVGLSGVQQGAGVNPGLQFQRQQFADERQFDGRQPQPQFGQFGGQQFIPQQQFGGQQGAGLGLGNPQLGQGGFGVSQQQQQQRPFLFPQQGPLIGTQGPFPGQQGFGVGAGNPQFQQQQFGPQQFRQPFGLGGPQTGNRFNSFNARPVQGQQQQQFNDGFNDPQFGGPGFGFDGQQQGDFGPFSLGGGGVNRLNQFGLQQQNPILSNQLGGFNGAGVGVGGAGVGAGLNRNPVASGVRINPNGDSGLRTRPSNVGAANSQEYVPSVELDGFSEDADQDGFVDRFPGSAEGTDKKAAQTEEKTPAVKTPDGRQVNENEPVQYRPQILGPQQQRPQGLRPGFQQQQPQLPINQFGGVAPYDEDQLNQLYLQLGQQNGRFGPQFIAGSPQAQFAGGFPGGTPQYLGSGGPQFLQPGFQGQQQRPFQGGGQGSVPQQQSTAGLHNQPQQQLLSQGQGQGRFPAQQFPVTGLEQLQTVNDGTGIQEQYQPQILTGPAGQAQFAQSPNYQGSVGGVGFGGPDGPGFQSYPGFNPYGFADSPYSPALGFGGPQQFQQQPFINPQQLQQQQQLLGQSPQRGPQQLLGQQQQPQSQSQSQQPQSQQLLGQGSHQLSLGGIVNGGGSDRRERDSGSNEDKKTN